MCIRDRGNILKAAFTFNIGRHEGTNYEREIKKEFTGVKEGEYSKRAYFNNTHDNMTNVWSFKRTTQEERKYTGGHATPKPLELCARGIKSSSRPGDIVVDFLGARGQL